MPRLSYKDLGAIQIEGRQQQSLAIGASAADSAELGSAGVYDVWSDVDCFIKVDSVAADDVTDESGYLLRAGATLPLFIDAGRKIGAIAASGSGTLRFHKVQ